MSVKHDKVKQHSKAVPVHSMKVYKRSRCIAPFILDLRARQRRTVGFMPPLIYPQERVCACCIEEKTCSWKSEHLVYLLDKDAVKSVHDFYYNFETFKFIAHWYFKYSKQYDYDLLASVEQSSLWIMWVQKCKLYAGTGHVLQWNEPFSLFSLRKWRKCRLTKWRIVLQIKSHVVSTTEVNWCVNYNNRSLVQSVPCVHM